MLLSWSHWSIQKQRCLSLPIQDIKYCIIIHFTLLHHHRVCQLWIILQSCSLVGPTLTQTTPGKLFTPDVQQSKVILLQYYLFPDPHSHMYLYIYRLVFFLSKQYSFYGPLLGLVLILFVAFCEWLLDSGSDF